VDKNIGDADVSRPNHILHFVRDVVSGAHGDRASDAKVQIDVEMQAHFANETFFHFANTFDSCGRAPNPLAHIAARRGVHDFVQRWRKQSVAVCRDERAGEKRRPIIRALPTFASDQCDGNSDESSDRGQGIKAVMPGVRLHRRAFDIPAQPNDRAVEHLLHNHDHDQHHERERRGRMMRGEYFPHACDRQANRRRDHPHRHDGRGDRFGLPVAIRMRLIRRSRRKPQPAPDDSGAADIERRLDPVRDERVSIPENAGGNLRECEHDVNRHAEERDARAALQIAGRIVRCRMGRGRHLMKKTIRAAIYEAHGNPAEVLRVVEQPWPTPAADEAVVQMRAAPINPADLNAIEGKYPVRPALPATPGMEGAGFVVEAGSSVRNVKAGDQVILPHNFGTWREVCAVKAEQLVVAPVEIEPVQAAMLKVNPITAWRLLHDFVPLRRGDWFIQNAANSAAGRATIQIGNELGYRSVSVVRRPELIEELRGEGGDVVLVESDALRDEVKSATAGEPIRLGLNCVGGESALRIANTLAPDATLVTYGAMSLQPLKIPNGLLIFKNLIFRGLWVNKWYDQATPVERAATFEPLFEMATRGLLRSKVEKTYSLSEAAVAVAHAAQSKRSGKIVFEFPP